MLAHVFPARADGYGFSEPRKPRQFPFGKHVPISDVVSTVNLVRRFGLYTAAGLVAVRAAARTQLSDRNGCILYIQASTICNCDAIMSQSSLSVCQRLEP